MSQNDITARLKGGGCKSMMSLGLGTLRIIKKGVKRGTSIEVVCVYGGHALAYGRSCRLPSKGDSGQRSL